MARIITRGIITSALSPTILITARFCNLNLLSWWLRLQIKLHCENICHV